MDLDKIRSFCVTGTFKGALPLESIEEAFEEMEHTDNSAS